MDLAIEKAKQSGIGWVSARGKMLQPGDGVEERDSGRRGGGGVRGRVRKRDRQTETEGDRDGEREGGKNRENTGGGGWVGGGGGRRDRETDRHGFGH